MLPRPSRRWTWPTPSSASHHRSPRRADAHRLAVAETGAPRPRATAPPPFPSRSRRARAGQTSRFPSFACMSFSIAATGSVGQCACRTRARPLAAVAIVADAEVLLQLTVSLCSAAGRASRRAEPRLQHQRRRRLCRRPRRKERLAAAGGQLADDERRVAHACRLATPPSAVGSAARRSCVTEKSHACTCDENSVPSKLKMRASYTGAARRLKRRRRRAAATARRVRVGARDLLLGRDEQPGLPERRVARVEHDERRPLNHAPTPTWPRSPGSRLPTV